MKDFKVNEKIDPFEIGCREFNPDEIFNAIHNTVKVWSWGAHAWRKVGNKALRFAVQGRHFTGHVYITLAFDDTFTIYYTTMKGTIKDIQHMIYIDQLIEVIDRKVEYIPEYKNN